MGSHNTKLRDAIMARHEAQQDSYNMLTMNLNKMINNEKEDRVRDEYHSTLPFYTDTLFLVLIVLVLLGLIVAAIWLCTRFRQARQQGAHARAARRLNIDTGGIGAPKHYISPVEVEMPRICLLYTSDAADE